MEEEVFTCNCGSIFWIIGENGIRCNDCESYVFPQDVLRSFEELKVHLKDKK